MKYKKWIIPEYDNNSVSDLSRSLDISPTLAKLLIHRNLDTKEKADSFLKKDFSAFYSPFLMKDIEVGANILIDAVKNHKKILIWGDYDVDGVTSVTVLLKYILSIGGICDYYIPVRDDDGYGLNPKVLKEYADKGFSLLVTVDSGITAVNEVNFAKNELNMSVIVTDHHECQSILPDADAIINPKRLDCTYPFKELAGVGVVFKFITAVEMLLFSASVALSSKKLCKLYSDFVAIGTIADVMPITEENRIIVNSGLKSLENTRNKGLSALIHESGIDLSDPKKKKISSSTIGFVLAPRINAAGRMGTSKIAVDLFMTESHEEAAFLASELTRINKERQVIENEILTSALEKVQTQCDLQNDKVLILTDDNWHHGIIGIVSSRITEKYNLPSVLISFKNMGDNGEVGKGSARSVKGMNLVKALSDSSHLLEKFGGHTLAAGLSIKRSALEDFKKRMNDYARKNLDEESIIKTLDIDCEISSFDASVELATELSYLAPFGLSNPVPLFCTKDMKVLNVIEIGSRKHTKLLLEKDGILHTALVFGSPASSLQICEGDFIDVAFNLDINNFKNQQLLQFIVRDIRPSKRERDITEQHLYIYDKMLNDDDFKVSYDNIPKRSEFVQVYNTLRYILQSANDSKKADIYIPYLAKMINLSYNCEIPLFKVLIILDVLSNSNLIQLKHTDTLNRTLKGITPYSVNKKILLEETDIIKKLYSKVH